MVQTLASVHQEVIGKPRQAFRLIYGPGDAGVAHGSGEFISLDQMLAGTEAIVLMLCEWCGAAR
ncbi:MAG: hypothetical protein DLM67_17975 [Candidatus Nephthysia bennettiae]|nr:hypothetical protein [Candidatus Dormibacteraeota bacterium]PZR90078.1 MAG: hypothetical protein DLM67_17975 [Candidatus Dormibacteraeota bacterium]